MWRRLESDIRRVALGDEASPELLEYIELLALTSLDESAGEGFHRATNAERTRAPSSRMVHLKGTTRHRYNLSYCKRFLKRYGEKGKRVFRFEWCKWKRIVQTNTRSFLSNRKMSSKKVVGTVYQEYAETSIGLPLSTA